jgi:hypothetical protein
VLAAVLVEVAVGEGGRVGGGVLVGVLVGVSTGVTEAVDVDVLVGVEVGTDVGVDAFGKVGVTVGVGVAVRMVTVVTVPLSQPAVINCATKTPTIDTTRTRGDTRIAQPPWSSRLRPGNVPPGPAHSLEPLPYMKACHSSTGCTLG